MADDEIVILDEEDLDESVEERHLLEEETEASEQPKRPNRLLHLIIALLVLLIILGSTLGYLYYQKKVKERLAKSDVNTSRIIQKLRERPKERAEKRSEVQKLLQEAKKLYEQNRPDEALAIYRKIADYNKALSFYNIGVAHLKNHHFPEAIEAFTKAMESDRLKCESALNSAIAAYQMGNRDNFRRYLDIAWKYLPLKYNTPLYSYLRALIHYYRNEYPETLLTLHHPTSDFYAHRHYLISAKLFSALQNDKAAIDRLEQLPQEQSAMALGLLHARTGEYEVAAKHLSTALNGEQAEKAAMALTLVDMKRGLFEDASTNLKNLLKSSKTDPTTLYPIRTHLREALFDPVIAQREFAKRLFSDPQTRYGLLFHYAPYRLFDTRQTLDQIKKGARQLSIDEMAPAMKNLERGEKISRINLAITEAIDKANRHRLYEANEIFKKHLSLFPHHSVLHYDLALSYAQLFDFARALKHFQRSYALDPNNHMAALFTLYCAKLLHKELPEKFLERVKSDIFSQPPSHLQKRLGAMLKVAGEDMEISLSQLTKDPQSDDFDRILALLIAQKSGNIADYFAMARALQQKYPRSILANILYLDAKYGKEDIKTYAHRIQQTFTTKKLDFTPLFYGGAVVRELFANILNIAGITHYGKKLLLKRMQTTDYHPIAALQTLAYLDIYTRDFEEAYQTYNRLIDNYKQSDTHTLFLASVASIGAGHNANAIALMELAKLTEPSNMESRFALGILYHEAKNLEAAAIQYQRIGNSGFHSHFFDYSLKQ